MSILHLSIATSSLVKRSLPEDSRQQPFICRIAASLCDTNGNETDHFACLIRSEDGKRVDPEATRRHGITSAACTRSGVAERFALGMILGYRAHGAKRPIDLPGLASCVSAIICWDADFVRAVVNARYALHGEPHGSWIRPGLQFYSLQQTASPWCRLPAPAGDDGQYKNPTRDEAAAVLLGTEPRALPHTVDDNLRLERAIFAVLAERKAFEMEGAA